MKEKVLGELKKVFYPGKAHSVLEEGIIEDVVFTEGNKLIVKIKMKEKNQVVVDMLKRTIPLALKRIEGIEKVELEVENPDEEGEKIADIKHIIATTSGKGGVGKTTVSVNLALALAKFGYRVGLLDADIHGPNVPTMMGIEGASVTVDPKTKDKIKPITKYGIKVISIGNLVPKNVAVIWRGPLVSQAIRQFLTDVSWGELDFLVVDLPPGTGDAQITIAQETNVNGGLIVITPQNVAMSDAMKAYDFFKKLKIPVLGVIENMSYFICPNCGARTDIFDHGGAKKFAEDYNLTFLGEIPIDVKLREGGDKGKPIVVADPSSPVTQAFEDIARNIIEKLKSTE